MLVSAIPTAEAIEIEGHWLHASNFRDDEVENTSGWGGSLIFPLVAGIKVDLGGDWLRPKIKDSGGAKVTLIPVTTVLRVGIDLALVYLYGGAGIGYSFNDSETPDAMKAVGLKVKLEDEIFYCALAGIEVGLVDTLAIRGEFRYNWMRPDFKVTGAGVSEKEEVKADHMQLRLGLAVGF
jgi:opacity protein-like surface antigen